VLDVRDGVVVELAELADQALIGGCVDRVRAEVADVAELVAQLDGELALDEALQERRQDHADQRTDEEERDGDLAAESHTRA
jgi:hypothetical protein